MILIASGAYLDSEFASEVGLLPPSFLPVGNKRLYEYQVEFLRGCGEEQTSIYLSVPSSYRIDVFDQERLIELDVKVIRVLDNLSLGSSILYCWNSNAENYDSLTLLHGDTLFLNSCYQAENALTIHENKGFYKRATLGEESKEFQMLQDAWSGDCERVVSGFFKFSDPLLLMKSLVELEGDFIKGILNYEESNPLTQLSEGQWLDFGHINSFYHSRSSMTTQRSFNDLKISSRSVKKTSPGNSKKIFAEGNWFEQLPKALRLYTPALLDLQRGDEAFTGATYELEYLYLLPLNDLFVFSNLQKSCWQTIFNAILALLKDFAKHKPEVISADLLSQINSLYLEKTKKRLADYEQVSGVNVETKSYLVGEELLSLVQIAEEAAKFIKPSCSLNITISHGDLCFSNLLFDNRVESIKCIDPRGITPNGELSVFGDNRYDIAKLYHSVAGFYDHIIAERYKSEFKNDQLNIDFVNNEKLYEDILESFRKTVLKPLDVDEKEILAITVHLFLSMLPLHSDRPDRQKAFIANAIRLFKRLLEMKI